MFQKTIAILAFTAASGVAPLAQARTDRLEQAVKELTPSNSRRA